MKDLERVKQHYLNVARSMGLVPEQDQALTFELETNILSHGDLTTQYPQIRVWSSGHNNAEVTIWTTINSADSVKNATATLNAGTNVVEITWIEDNPDCMSNMSVDLWELKFRFKNTPGAGLFDFQLK